MKSILTVKDKVSLAEAIKKDWVSSNTYLGIGHVRDWSNNDVTIPDATNSTDSINSMFDSLVAMKKITGNDLWLVIPRIDWEANTIYRDYDNQIDMFSTEIKTLEIGSINVASGCTVVSGANTVFSEIFTRGDIIEYVNAYDNTIGRKEVIEVLNNTSLVVNTSYSTTITGLNFYKISSTYPKYSRNFYVRNSYDQVFKCLLTPKDPEGNIVPSTFMPEISLGGQLPQNPYIQMDDGYRWKYLYTMPSDLKRKFFTNDWMPVYYDNTVINSAINGAIDIIKIEDGGQDYNNRQPNTGIMIVNIQGNGSGASAYATVDSNGSIVDVKMIDNGSGYTKANVIVSDISGSGGFGASLRAIIGPDGGHGYSPSEDLGATNLMLCVELSGDEGGNIPVQSEVGTDIFDYHQISIIKNPKLSSNNSQNANSTVYRTTPYIETSGLGVDNFFYMDDTVFIGTTLTEATFSATIVNWDASQGSKLYINNINGTFVDNSTLRATRLNRPVTGFILVEPEVEPYSGDVLYVENRSAVSRASGQTEQIRLVIEL